MKILCWRTFFVTDIGIMVKAFARETLVQLPAESYQRLKKIVFDAYLLNTQHYKVRFKGIVRQSWEMSSALPYTLV